MTLNNNKNKNRAKRKNTRNQMHSKRTTTQTQTEKSYLTVSGYIHNLITTNVIDERMLRIPVEILSIIVDYYCIGFEWNFEITERGKGWEMVTDEAHPDSVRYTLDGVDSFLWSKDEVSLSASDHHRAQQFDYEIRVDKKLKRDINFFLGFVSSEIPMALVHEKLNRFPKKSWNTTRDALLPCAVYVYSVTKCFRLFGRDGDSLEISNSDTKRTKCKFDVNDRFLLRFHFCDRTCSLYYNDAFVSVVYKDVPPKIKLFLCSYSALQFTCTKCSPFYPSIQRYAV